MTTPISQRAYARPELLADTGWLAERLGDQRIRLVDARSAGEYAGGHIAGAVHMDGFGSGVPRDEDEYEGKAGGFGSVPRLGRIPGAVHLEWTELLDPQSRTLKPAAALHQLLASRGISPDKEVASYCNGGARGALGAFVLKVLGYDGGRAYAGSFQQWSNQPDTAVER